MPSNGSRLGSGGMEQDVLPVANDRPTFVHSPLSSSNSEVGFVDDFSSTWLLLRYEHELHQSKLDTSAIDSHVVGICRHARAQEGTRAPEALDREAFFETRIRPLLIQHCYECHSADTEINGGLSLDAKAGWELGGDRGPALVPGEPDASLFMRAIEYKDPRLKMPPDGKLSSSAVEAFRRWIAEGAYDPRVEAKQALQKSKGLSLEESLKHWSYRPLERPALPDQASGRNPRTNIDAFVEQRLESEGLSPAPPASRSILLRRLKFDLHGLPPTSQEIRDFEDDVDPNAYERLVDQLLASPRFGERMARRWLDVARFAESYTLRGFVMPEAWRYRDYCVQAFNGDLPWNQFVKEQLAGDLLQSPSMEVRRREQTAVAFLLLGNNNLEEQDKDQLDMDVIDEQLETLGKAFLGQTIGCARCHDHKFDPIPTKDYYALAGILKSSVVLKHENVSKWIEVPLPVDEPSDKHFKQVEQEHARIQAEVKKLEKGTKPDKGPSNNKMVAVESLEGLVIDDAEARKVGEWQSSTTIRPFVGSNYLHDGANGRGMKTITFEPASIPPGKYEVRLAYAPGTNRASNALVRIFSADGEAIKSIDQRAMPPIQDLWISLGNYRFEKDGQAFVLISNEGADGHVIADAVQFLRADEAIDKKIATKKDGTNGDAVSPATPPRPSVAEVAKRADQDKRLKELKETAKKLEAELSQRPMVMGLQTVAGKDIAVHIRGSVHALGEVVPRGFLQLSDRAMSARGTSSAYQGDSQSLKAPDRRDLAEWMVDPRHPLTARVAANRVWYWLMGKGWSTPSTTSERQATRLRILNCWIISRYG